MKFDQAIKCLSSAVAARKEIADDKTGVITQYTKDESVKIIGELELAIRILSRIDEVSLLERSQEDIPPEFVKILNDEFWNLI